MRIEQPVEKYPASAPREQPAELERTLPPYFVAQTMAKIELHVVGGNWQQAKTTIDECERLWEAEKIAADRLVVDASDHVTALRLDVRTVNAIDSVCAGTVGALLECFPKAFVNRPGIGPQAVRMIADALLRAGLIDVYDHERRLNQYMVACSDTQRWRMNCGG